MSRSRLGTSHVGSGGVCALRRNEWVFASPLGEALNPDSDYHEWKATRN